MDGKNINVSEEVYSDLKELKRDGETFDELLRRMYNIPPYGEDEGDD